MDVLAEPFKSSKCRGHHKFISAQQLILMIIGCTLLQTVLQLAEAADTQFGVNNTALLNGEDGGTRFENDFGNERAIAVLESAKSFCLSAFNLSIEKSVSTVTLFVDGTVIDPAVAVTSTRNGQASIHLSENYAASKEEDDNTAFVFAITGVLYHESTHVWQNQNGSYQSDQYFTGVVEGVADYIRLSSGFASTNWKKQDGGNWYDGYYTTAYFLDWIAQNVLSGFVNQLNAKMTNQWTNDFFYEITGQTVDELWSSYQDSF